MHASSLDRMTTFVRDYLADARGRPMRILDVGSQNVNGCYRPLFDDPAWSYTGLDLESGDNVDVVVDNPYRWNALPRHGFDLVISGQAFEHIEFFWLSILEIERVLKPGGLCCVIAPAGGYEHRYPVDCWRFYPDGFRALARYARLEPLLAHTQWEPIGYQDGSDVWQDSVLVARKPELSVWRRALRDLRRTVLQRASRV